MIICVCEINEIMLVKIFIMCYSDCDQGVHYNSAHLNALSYICAGQGNAVCLVQPDHSLGVVTLSCKI